MSVLEMCVLHSIFFSGGTPEQDWYDPSEPRYCICNQVSYGDMVACDNEDVRKFIFSSIIRIKFLVYDVNLNLQKYINICLFFKFQCPYEWFHYPCVGIEAPPKGKWYCPTCTANMARRKGRK